MCSVCRRVYIIGWRGDGALNGCFKWPERDLIKMHSNVPNFYIFWKRTIKHPWLSSSSIHTTYTERVIFMSQLNGILNPISSVIEPLIHCYLSTVQTKTVNFMSNCQMWLLIINQLTFCLYQTMDYFDHHFSHTENKRYCLCISFFSLA